MRPTDAALPTPVARIAAGYTCAANAYIVVCTALIIVPDRVRRVRRSAVDMLRSIVSAPNANELATAAAVRVSMVVLDPNRLMTIAPNIAPTTPPKLKHISPRLARGPRPAPLSSVGIQEKLA